MERRADPLSALKALGVTVWDPDGLWQACLPQCHINQLLRKEGEREKPQSKREAEWVFKLHISLYTHLMWPKQIQDSQKTH